MKSPWTLSAGFVLLSLLLPIGTITIAPATADWPMFWQVRAFLVNYSGAICMLAMSATVILSVKHWPLESWLQGLDKQYRLHKYLGIVALVTATLHWLTFMSDDIAVDSGWVATPISHHFPFWALSENLAGFAQLLGEWSFYIASVTVIVALVKYFSYKLFQALHRALPYIYLVMVVHSVLFFDTSYWLSPIGLALAPIMTLATIGCLLTIFGKNGAQKQTPAYIHKLEPLSNGLMVTLRSNQSLPQYKAGQFIFIQFDDKEAGHPFSIASSTPDEIRLLIKENGDYTNTLKDTLVLKQDVMLEGAYGQFCFDDQQAQQIWVAGGIGIAPFLSAFENIKPNVQVDLFYTFQQEEPVLIQELEEKAKQYHVRLHLVNTQQREHLSLAEVQRPIQDLQKTCVWFCGPVGLGSTLKKGLIKQGLKSANFHQELFDFR